jgi:hypothetical protein
VRIPRNTVVVEVRGGTVVAIYGAKYAAKVVLVDWDEHFDNGRPGIEFDLDPISRLPPDTRALVEEHLSGGWHPTP